MVDLRDSVYLRMLDQDRREREGRKAAVADVIGQHVDKSLAMDERQRAQEQKYAERRGMADLVIGKEGREYGNPLSQRAHDLGYDTAGGEQALSALAHERKSDLEGAKLQSQMLRDIFKESGRMQRHEGTETGKWDRHLSTYGQREAHHLDRMGLQRDLAKKRNALRKMAINKRATGDDLLAFAIGAARNLRSDAKSKQGMGKSAAKDFMVRASGVDAEEQLQSASMDMEAARQLENMSGLYKAGRIDKEQFDEAVLQILADAEARASGGAMTPQGQGGLGTESDVDALLAE